MLWNMKVTVIVIVDGAMRTTSIDSGITENLWKNPYPKDPSIVKIGYIIQKSPGDLKRLAFTQAPEKGYHLRLV